MRSLDDRPEAGDQGDRHGAAPAAPVPPEDRGPAGRTVSLEGHADRTLTLTNLTGDVGLDPGTFLQRSGVNLFLKVLAVSCVVLLALFINLMVELAHVPEVPPGSVLRNAFMRGDTVQTLRLAAHYGAVSEVALAHRNAAWSHFILGVKELVVTVFLPLMTGILGYIFGTRTEAAQNGAGGGDAEP
jgi:predicted small integral membrane protein